MKRLILIVLCMSIASLVFSTDYFNKMDPRLKLLMKQNISGNVMLSKNHPLLKSGQQPLINVFIKGDVHVIRAAVENSGGNVNTVTESILTAQLSKDAVIEIAKMDAVQRIKLAVPVRKRNSQAIVNIRADKVHSGDSPLIASYNGDNVVVGIIDSGIDWKHEDFLDPADTTKSRILFIWDQSDEQGPSPTGFSYGTEWTKAQLDNELDGSPENLVRHKDDDESAGGHGTHVSGTAAGNDGIAPGADIIVVGLDFENSTGVIDGANYIYQKAAELGRPAVVNASLGTHFGPHDGSGAESQAIDNLVTSGAGRIFCAAAGNEGSDYIHYGNFEVQAEESWTYYYTEPLELEEDLFIELYMIVPTEDIHTLSLAIGVDRSDFNETENGLIPVSPTLIEKTTWKTIQEIINDEVAERLYYQNDVKAGEVIIQASTLDSKNTEVYIEITDVVIVDNDGYYAEGLDLWRLCTKGSGTFHVWSEGVLSIPDPSSIDLTVDGNYHAPDNQYTVGMPGDATEVITVGAYTNRDQWIDYYGQTRVTGITVGTRAEFSSYGPTIDNRIKPEIVAPGHFVASALSSYIEESDFSSVLSGGKYIIQSGTSMASPVTSGAVALLLEKNPDYTNTEVRSALFDYAYVDNFVKADGNLPNNAWGYGKLDIFGAMTGQSVGISDYAKESIRSFDLIQNYPNPFNPVTTIAYQLSATTDIAIKVYNLLGQEMKTLVRMHQKPGSYTINWDGRNAAGVSLPSGVYICRMEANGFYSVRKMILMK